MNAAVRWLLVPPAGVAATAAAWIALTVVWNVTRTVNIVPQDDVVSVGLANFAINAGASGIGVFAAAKAAPRACGTTAIIAASLMTVFALSTLALGTHFRAGTGMSLGWHIFSTAAWIIGAIAAALAVRKGQVSQGDLSDSR